MVWSEEESNFMRDYPFFNFKSKKRRCLICDKEHPATEERAIICSECWDTDQLERVEVIVLKILELLRHEMV